MYPITTIEINSQIISCIPNLSFCSHITSARTRHLKLMNNGIFFLIKILSFFWSAQCSINIFSCLDRIAVVSTPLISKKFNNFGLLAYSAPAFITYLHLFSVSINSFRNTRKASFSFLSIVCLIDSL